ncbi:MAG: glycoside hydrolase family 88 protein [Sphingobacteriaceae bacterium]|nr:glycoside hydrolase family 88 protein [Sphingobacteriaceae bacterium]
MMMLSCSVTRPVSFMAGTALPSALDQHFADATAQYKFMMKNLPEGRFPKTFDPKTGKQETSNSAWWCSGFYPGTLLYLYEQTKDPVLYAETERILKLLEKEKNNKSTHDLGFMMYCSFGNANRIAPKPEYKDILITSAKSLATRFNPKTGVIRSWDSKDPSQFLVIIDNMMNLELLFWASKATGDLTYRNIAITHANNTLKNHFRPDYSSYHVLEYETETGKVNKKRTHQGYADESAWARGQAWGLYGFVVMYRETKDEKYLEQAKNIAGFILNHPNLPSDKVPYWDFNAPNIPNALRDASAGSIIASALLELCTYVKPEGGKELFSSAETMLASLASSNYKTAIGGNGGFILMHGVGNMPAKTEIDTPLTYGDYYYVEALVRYKSLIKK